jgi:cleavage and polyadenylation specificity factor subunit 1
LKEYRDTAKVVIFTLDIAAQHYPILTVLENLPHDSMYLLPCPTSLGGVVVITSNAIVYVDQSSRRIVLPVNGWISRISDVPALSADPNRQLILEGSRSIFVDEKTFFLVLKDGTVYPVDILVDGKTVSKLMMSPPLAQTSIPSIVRNIGNDHIFIGSTAGPSVLLKAARVDEEIEGNDVEEVRRTAIVWGDDAMEYDDEDEGLQMIHEC